MNSKQRRQRRRRIIRFFGSVEDYERLMSFRRALRHGIGIGRAVGGSPLLIEDLNPVYKNTTYDGIDTPIVLRKAENVL